MTLVERGHLVHESRIEQLTLGDVDVDREVRPPRRLPRGSVAGCDVEHPRTDGRHQPAPFGDGDEQTGRNGSEASAVPAQEGFEADETSVDDLGDRLVDDAELVVGEGVPQRLGHVPVRFGDLAGERSLDVVVDDPVAAGVLGERGCHVGLAQQCVGARCAGIGGWRSPSRP